MKPAVLITDGEQRAALAAARSLGTAGYAVDVCSLRGRSLAGASRYVRQDWLVPDPLTDPEAYVERIAEVCRDRGIRILLPITEASLLAVLGEGERLVDAIIPFPALDVFRNVSDKKAVYEAAGRVGIAVPRQRVLFGADELEQLTASDVRDPVVLKPARSVGEAAGQRVKVGVRYAADAASLRAECEGLPQQAFPLLVQQRIVGPGVGVFLLLWEGKRVAVFSHRRLREKPPSGGVSVYCESIPADPGLVDASQKLLQELGWRHGVAMVEYKVESRTGTPYLMEVNGRFWGSLQLAIDAGVDFPLLLVERALGLNSQEVDAYRAGVRSRWWWGDVDHLIARLRRSARELALPSGSAGRVRSLIEFLRPTWREGRVETFRLDDPRPFFRETAQWFRPVG